MTPETLAIVRRTCHDGWVRAGILLASHTEMSVKQIAELYDTDESQVRRVIREFNEEGFKTLDPTEGAGARGGSMRTSATPSSPSPSPVPAISGCL